MSQKKEINKFKSFLQFSYGTWGVALISFFTTPVITWLILPEDFGKAAMFTLAYNLLLNLVLLGSDQSFSRMYYDRSAEERSELLCSSIVIPILLCILSFFLLISLWPIISPVLFSEQTGILIAIMLSGTILFGILSRFGLLNLRMQQVANAYSILQIVSGITNILFVIGYAYFISKDFYAIIFGFFFANFLTAILSIVLQLDIWKKAISSFNLYSTRSIIKYGLPFVPVFLIEWLFQATDRFFLKHYAGFAEIGLYTASFKIVTALNLLQSGFNLFWVPFSYEKFSQQPEEKNFYKKTFNFLSLFLFIVITVIIGFKELIAGVLAHDYSGIAEIIPFLLFVPAMYTLSEITVVGINFKKKTHFHLYISSISFICNAVLCAILIPTFGVKGAAISTCISYIAFFATRSFFSYIFYKIKYDWIKFVISAGAVLCTAGFHTFLPSGPQLILSNLLTLTIILILYFSEIKEILDISKRIYHRKYSLAKSK